MDDYINGEIVELGVLEYDLSPRGVNIVRKYMEGQNADEKWLEYLKKNPKETKETAKKSIIEKNEEHNIDMINLLLGGILTQDFKDLINSKEEEDIKRLSDEITEYLDQVMEFVGVIKDKKVVEEVEKVLKTIEERKSSFGLEKEIILNIEKNLSKIGKKNKTNFNSTSNS